MSAELVKLLYTMAMDTETSLTILVTILSITLAIFLVVAIVATVKIIQILNQLKKIVDKAEAVGDFFRRTAGAAAFGKLIANITEAVRNRKRGRN